MDRDEEWIVLFGEGEPRGAAWWHRFLAPGFRHVMALRGVEPGTTLTIQHVGSRTLTAMHYAPAERVARFYLDARVSTLALRVHVKPAAETRLRAMLRPPMSCVEVVKGHLGIVAHGVLTPRQLARHLLRAGASQVLGTRSVHA